MENQTIKEILGLSSGTVAGLTGYEDYKRIDIIQVKLTQFTIGILASAPNEFSKWQEAWERFETVYNQQAPLKFADWCEDPKGLKPIGDASLKKENIQDVLQPIGKYIEEIMTSPMYIEHREGLTEGSEIEPTLKGNAFTIDEANTYGDEIYADLLGICSTVNVTVTEKDGKDFVTLRVLKPVSEEEDNPDEDIAFQWSLPIPVNNEVKLSCTTEGEYLYVNLCGDSGTHFQLKHQLGEGLVLDLVENNEITESLGWLTYDDMNREESEDLDGLANSEENPHRFTYMMLSRLQQDNKYFLGNGNGSERNLWALDVESQIKEMRRLWDILPEGEKPEWLTMDEITEFETEMYKKLALDESMDIVAETRAKIAETKAQNQTKETSSPSPKN